MVLVRDTDSLPEIIEFFDGLLDTIIIFSVASLHQPTLVLKKCMLRHPISRNTLTVMLSCVMRDCRGRCCEPSQTDHTRAVVTTSCFPELSNLSSASASSMVAVPRQSSVSLAAAPSALVPAVVCRYSVASRSCQLPSYSFEAPGSRPVGSAY